MKWQLASSSIFFVAVICTECSPDLRRDAAKPKPGTVRINPTDNLAYVWIPPGTFQMGCSRGDTDCFESEKPSHPVTISKGFWLGQTDVTVAAYEVFARATGASISGVQSGDRYPVVNVTWLESQDYCKWASGRLPTEAEWEYAARGGVAEARYGPLESVAWYSGNSSGSLHEVAAKQPNRYGLYDMLGKVFVWTSDWYDENYYRASPTIDPQGPSGPSDFHNYRVLRGGNYGLDENYARAFRRLRHEFSERRSSGGVRCVWAK